MVRAKFYCEEIIESAEQNGSKIVLYPVVYGSEENERFFNLTPYGKVELGTVNPNAVQQFEVGNEYYVDFTKVE